ncbi:MAG: cation diffusion facilitator family transporter, partial [Clostridia bacterium]|nr:cation diffusion facilitator family transporter [Clostridia bacterium]
IKIAKKPIDKNHPYGHGKVEPLAAFFVGIVLFFAAITVTERIIQSIIAHSFTAPSYIALIAAFISIITKEIMFRITYAEGKKINSESIMANAWDHRSDAYSSMATALGIGASMIGHHFGILWLKYMDHLAGTIVALMIFRVAYCIIKQAVKGLMDSSPEAHVLDEIEYIILECEDVLGVPWIKARYIGQHLFIDLALEVDANMTVKEGHTISTEIEKKIKSEVKNAYEVIVHVEPSES